MKAKIEGIEELDIDLPDLRKFFNDNLVDEVAKLGKGSIISNIKDQVTYKGGQLKQTQSKATKAHKRRFGLPMKSLIDLGRRLIRPASWVHESNLKGRMLNSSKLIVTIKPSDKKSRGVRGQTSESPKDLAKWVQARGYVDWIGMRKEHKKALNEMIAKRLLSRFKKELKKRG